MDLPKIVSREEWLTARKELLAKEKKETRRHDGLRAERQALPMVSVDKDYRSTAPNAQEILMRKLVVTENITLDGVIDMAEGWFDPLNEDVDQSDITTANTEHQETADALLVGRNTFEIFRGFWPKQTDDPTGVSDYLNAVNKYVVSSTLDDPGWENSTVLRGPVVEEVRRLKEAPGRDIVATGSTLLVHALIAAGLVDEYRLFVFPVVVGRGARLFESANVKLKLLETRPFVSGAVLLRYAVAGHRSNT